LYCCNYVSEARQRIKNTSCWVSWLILVISATQKVKTGGIMVWSQLGQKVSKTPFRPHCSWVWWCMPATPARKEHK
jgi:hypothetical protein